jgi:uncharacterized protein (TIGR00369 family)
VTVPDLSRSVGLDALLGTEYVELSGDRVVARCEVRAELHQPFGILHGGVYCSLVESTASLAAALWYGARGRVVGVSNHTNFLRAVRTGTLVITALPVQRGRTQQLWRVEISCDEKLSAVGEVRLANLPAEEAMR